MKNVYLILSIISILLLSSCGGGKNTVKNISVTIPLELTKLPQSDIYLNMDYGVKLNVLDKRSSANILNRNDDISVIYNMSTYPEIKPFVSESMKTYMKTMGFSLDADVNTDYLLQIEITQFQVSFLSGTGWIGTVCLDMLIFDESRNQVYPRTTITGRAIANDNSNGKTALNTAYINALENIDWDKVAYFLRRAKTAAGEKNKRVEGEGNTALEHTVIRWFVDSTPKGADVHWRVVSSTSDVKNTNQVYLGTTPYESTETFDIKGLTFNNSGNVQIEIVCEKPGYSTQKRRFNLRQAIEQKEISTKFNMIKEEQ